MIAFQIQIAIGVAIAKMTTYSVLVPQPKVNVNVRRNTIPVSTTENTTEWASPLRRTILVQCVPHTIMIETPSIDFGQIDCDKMITLHDNNMDTTDCHSQG